jgi:hypothetical protein
MISALATTLLGVCIGAFIQFVFTRNVEASKQRSIQRDDAYARYLNAVTLRKRGVDEGQLTEAKSRLLVFGSKKVVQKLGLIEQYGAVLSTKECQTAFVELVLAMRNESQGLDPDLIHLVIFGK